LLVIPAKAGIQLLSQNDEELDPGFRRDDEQERRIKMDPRVRGNDGKKKGQKQRHWIPAFAGMTSRVQRGVYARKNKSTVALM
jgi:hypothetical protein